MQTLCSYASGHVFQQAADHHGGVCAIIPWNAVENTWSNLQPSVPAWICIVQPGARDDAMVWAKENQDSLPADQPTSSTGRFTCAVRGRSRLRPTTR